MIDPEIMVQWPRCGRVAQLSGTTMPCDALFDQREFQILLGRSCVVMGAGLT